MFTHHLDKDLTRSEFVFATCQVGAEPALKAELAREHPELRFAYARPGFVTFKRASGAAGPDAVLRSVFARAYGVSLGRGAAGEVLAVARALAPMARLHVWERDRFPPGEEPLGFEPGKLAAAAERAIRAAELASGAPAFLDSPGAERGDAVVDVVIVEEDEWWIGAHLHAPGRSPFPGGRPRIALPPEAPSRAYLKLEEALLWSGAPVRAGDVAVEIGSAPGGASYALLRRGVSVVGIDPGEMAPAVLGFAGPARFTHIRRPVANVLREELPAEIHWLLVDMNVAPNVSMYAADRLASRMKGSLLGVLLTIKLNQWQFAEQIPSIVEHVRAMGMSRAKATQLAHNRQEVFVFGLNRKGVARGG